MDSTVKRHEMELTIEGSDVSIGKAPWSSESLRILWGAVALVTA